MPIARSEPVEGMDGWIWDIFETTPKMSTYTMAFAIQDFESVSGTGNMTVWANKELIDAGYADYASVVGSDSITIMEELFGIKYTLSKMDMVHAPQFAAGAMENWGLVLYEYDYILYDKSNPDDNKKWDVIETISHELAH